MSKARLVITAVVVVERQGQVHIGRFCAKVTDRGETRI